MPDYRVEFTESCRRKLERLAPPEALQEVLATVINDLGENPYVFRPVELVDERGGRTEIRVVRADLYVSELGVVQPLSLFFVIIESRKQVLVLDVLPRPGFGLDPNSP